MCVTAIPLLILLFLQYQNNTNLLATLSSYEEADRAYSEAEVYLLSESVAAGDAITSDVLTPCLLKIPKSTSVQYVRPNSQLEGTYAKTGISRGSILTNDMIFKSDDFLTKNRCVDITDILLPTNLSPSDLLEIRISFPNGEDYVVLKQQKIKDLLQEEDIIYGITLTLSEEELLRLSSARVDVSLYKGTSLYAVIYQTDYETAAVVDYPVNTDVFSLIKQDPNILVPSISSEEAEQRKLLEERLYRFAQLEKEAFSSVIVPDKNYNVSQP